MYNPYDWYWLADDGRLYSSKRNIVVDVNDATYIAWVAAPFQGHWRQNWPRDEVGDQTTETMQLVMTPYDIVLP